MKVELLSLVLTLQPLELPPVTAQRPAPGWWGRAAQALLLDIVRQSNPALAEQLHDSDTLPRPYSASTLMGSGLRSGPNTTQTYTLRLAALQPELAEILLQAAMPGGRLAVGAALELDYRPFQVLGVTPDPADPAAPVEQPWAGATAYAELSAPFLLAKQIPPRRFTFQFTSPVTFKSHGQFVPVPLPGLLFGSLLERWNAYAPIAFPPEARRYAEEVLALSRYQLTSRAVPVHASAVRMGGVGQATYTALSYDRYWMSVMACLAAFARFAGAGAGVTAGLGQCRWLEAEE